MSNAITLPVADKPATAAQPARKRVPAPAVEAERAPAAEPARPALPDLSGAIETIRDMVADMQRDLQFSVDEDSGRTIITVIDSDSGQIIRQIPPEEVLQIARTVAAGGNFNLIDNRV